MHKLRIFLSVLPQVQRNPVIEKILELLQLWSITICAKTKYKDDLANIKEMIRLLSYKGYMFPTISPQDAVGFSFVEVNIKSKEEMEKEEHEAMGVKLKELLRRGTPKDLQEANDLMQKMAGYVGAPDDTTASEISL